MLIRNSGIRLLKSFRFLSTSAIKMDPSKVQLDISQGRIVGVERQLPNGKPFYAFKGIPYAEPTIGNLRFAAPRPLAKFKELVLDCSKERNVCFHRDFITSTPVGSEDCLFLNVYMPNLREKKDLPVMVWIHGGAYAISREIVLLKFVCCCSYSLEYLVEQNVIVVTLNYRLLFKNYFNTLTADERRRGLPIVFKPTIERESDEAIIIRSPLELMHDRSNSTDIPIMMGYNSKEGLIMFTDLYKKIDQVEEDLARLIPKSLNLSVNDPRCKMVEKQMRDFYLGGKRISEEVFDELVDLLTDYHFTIFFALAVELHAKYQKSQMYFYRFDVDMELNLYKMFALMALGMQETTKFKEMSHADEIYYMFKFNKYPMEPKEHPAAEAILRRTCALWTNFAKTGNPTADAVWNPIDKTSYQNNDPKWDYLAMENDKIEMRVNPDNSRVEFWKKLYDEYNNGLLKAKL